jgi:hypothetical protein
MRDRLNPNYYISVIGSIPQDAANPSSGVLFDYIVSNINRQLQLCSTSCTSLGSFYPFQIMNPILPDHETVMSQLGLHAR